MTAIVISLLFGSITLLVRQAAIDVSNGAISGGTVAAFVVTGAIVAGAFGALTEVYGDLLRGAGATGRITELMAEVPQIQSPPHPLPLPRPALGTLEFDAVTFRYPTRQDVSALHDFSLKVAPGETLAVVGPSGAGKTTFFQLAQRFYDPDAGAVRIDGVDLRAADLAEIRARIAVVPQETIIFAASARDNLRYGRWEAGDAELWGAAEAANAAEVPEEASRRPRHLSRRRRRAPLRRPAPAHRHRPRAAARCAVAAARRGDLGARRGIGAAGPGLARAAVRRRTTIVIAHRLATVRAADRILVMDHGRIVEEGNHDTLSAAGGLYARLARLQFEGLAA